MSMGNFPENMSRAILVGMILVDSLRGSSIRIGTIQRRLAWPLRKDDAQIEKCEQFSRDDLQQGDWVQKSRTSCRVSTRRFMQL